MTQPYVTNSNKPRSVSAQQKNPNFKQNVSLPQRSRPANAKFSQKPRKVISPLQLAKKFYSRYKWRPSWFKNKKPVWRRKSAKSKRYYGRFISSLTSHIRGVSSEATLSSDVNERHTWSYNVKYRRARFGFKNKIYLRRMFVKRYGFKDLLHIKNYHRRRIYDTRHPLQTAFSILEASLCRFVVRVGWARSIKLATGIVRLGGVNVGLHRTYSPRFLVKGLTAVSLRSRAFRASVRTTIKCIKRTRVSKPPRFSSREAEKIKNNPNYWRTVDYYKRYSGTKHNSSVFSNLAVHLSLFKRRGLRHRKFILRVAGFRLAQFVHCMWVSRGPEVTLEFEDLTYIWQIYTLGTGVVNSLLECDFYRQMAKFSRYIRCIIRDLLRRFYDVSAPLALIINFKPTPLSRALSKLAHASYKNKNSTKLRRSFGLSLPGVVFLGGRKRKLYQYSRHYRRRVRVIIRRRVPWRLVNRLLKTQPKAYQALSHPLPVKVFFKQLVAAYRYLVRNFDLRSRTKKIFLRQLFLAFISSNYVFRSLKDRHGLNKDVFNPIAQILRRWPLINRQIKLLNRKPQGSEYNGYLEISHRKAFFYTHQELTFYSYSWSKSANLIQLNRKVLDTFANQKLF